MLTSNFPPRVAKIQNPPPTIPDSPPRKLKNFRACGAILGEIYTYYILFGPPAGLLPPKAEFFFELFASFWDDLTVKNEHFLRVLQAISIKIFLTPDDLMVAKQGENS